jgi:uncharacterized repeat protein (TIGR04052 family)
MNRSITSIALLACLAGCERTEVSLAFEGLVGAEPARCGGSYAGIGLTGTNLELADLRLYIHDVRVVKADGTEVQVELTQGEWQYQNLALLDFEDGTTACEMGTAPLNTEVHGFANGSGPFTGVRFVLGVPFDLNHDDASTAPAPLNFTSMFWGWNGGYKFLRIDGRTTGQPDGFTVHIGSTGCEGDGRGNIESCRQGNLVEVALDMDPMEDTIAVDVAALLSENDMDNDAGGPETCMSGFDDPDCEPIFHAVGLPFDGRDPAAPQRFFRAVTP